MDAVGGRIGQESKWVGCRWLGAAACAGGGCSMHMLSHSLPLALAVAAKCTASVDCAPAPLLDLQAGETPLYEACRQGHTAVAQLLLDRGANVDAVSKARQMLAGLDACSCCALRASHHCSQVSPNAVSVGLAGCCLPCVAFHQLHAAFAWMMPLRHGSPVRGGSVMGWVAVIGCCGWTDWSGE